MLFDGLVLADGTHITNATVGSGTSFPTDVQSGELFFRTDLGELHVYDGSAWDVLQTVGQTTTGLATVATSGSYTDLINKPSIPAAYTDAQARAAISATGSLAYNSTTGVLSYTAPALSTVATSGRYSDLISKPTFAAVATSGAYSDLTGVPSLATVATTGSYADLTNKPTFASVAGSDTQVMYNNQGALAGSSSFTFNNAASSLGLPNMQLSYSAAGSNISIVGTGASYDFLVHPMDVGSNNAGQMTVRGGDASYNGGALVLRGGNSSTSGNGGNVAISGGTAASGTAGDVVITTKAIERVRFKSTGDWSIGGSSGTATYVLTSNGAGAAPSWQAIPAAVYEIPLSIQGLPTAGAKVLNFVAVKSYTLPVSLTGSYAKAGTAATGSSSFTIYKNGASIGTITFNGSATGTFSFTSAVTFAAGDLLVITAPASQNSSLADIAINLLGS